MHGVAGLEYPSEIYLTCIRVLEACGERKRALALLSEAHALLMQRADKISDEALRRSFLENVPAHRELAHNLTAHCQ